MSSLPSLHAAFVIVVLGLSFSRRPLLVVIKAIAGLVVIRLFCEPLSGEERSFRRPEDGATISVRGTNNPYHASLQQYAIGHTDPLEDTDIIVKPRYYTMYGTSGKVGLWRKVLRQKDQYIVIEVRYPPNKKAFYGPLFAKLNTCLQEGHYAF